MRTVIVSNRLPFTIHQHKKTYFFKPSDGGLVSSLGSVVYREKKNNYLWVGWPGKTIPAKQIKKVITKSKRQFNASPVFLPEDIVENFYNGFCNKVLWPLFHYFPQSCEYSSNYWNAYKKANEIFAQKLIAVLKKDDIVLVQDYHLLLLPQLLRKQFPHIKIGFFLHTPFPSYELFRLMPKEWSNELLEGVLGANLIGFHVQEYVDHFLDSIRHLLDKETVFGRVLLKERVVKVGAYPLGIDFAKYNSETGGVKKEKDNLRRHFKNKKIILSIDRLDYTKGIVHRLEAVEYLLQTYPQLQGKVTIILIGIPSRGDIGEYQKLKQKVEEKISYINGTYGTLEWMPIIYQYKSLSFEKLLALYKISDVALITPIRDGMNLIAKEYIAAQDKKAGMLVLSELTGAAKELPEALLINPNSPQEIAEAIYKSFTMDQKQKQTSIIRMQENLQKNTASMWLEKIIATLNELEKEDRYEKRHQHQKNTIHDSFVISELEKRPFHYKKS